MSVSLGSAQMTGYAVPAAHYFTDGTRGSDNNAGRTPGSAFATLSKLQSVLVTGQLGAIAGGYTYREQLTVPAANIGITGYNGKPTLDGSSIITSGCVVDGTFSNVYNVTVTTDSSLTGFLWPFENGVGMTSYASKALLDAATSGYFIASNGSLSGTSHTLSLHATGSGNPCSNGKTYEYNGRSYGLFSQYSGTLAAHLVTQHNYSNNGSFEIGPNSQAFDIIAKYGTKHNALMHGGSTYTDFTLSDSFYSGQSKILLVLNDNIPAGENATFVNITCTEAFETGSLCLYGHTNSGGIFGLVAVRNLNTSGLVTNAIGGFTSTDMLVDGGTIGGSITIGSNNSNIIRNIVSTSRVSVPYAVPFEIDSSAFTCADCTNGIVSFSNNVAYPSVSIHDTSLSNGRAFDAALYFGTGDTFGAVSLLRNTYLSPVQTNHLGGPGAVNLPLASTIDGNAYHYISAGSPSWIVFRGTTYNVAVLTPTGWTAWQALGFDATGQRVTP